MPLLPKLKSDKFKHLILDKSPRLKKDQIDVIKKKSLVTSLSKKSLLQAFPDTLVTLNKELIKNKISRF